MEDAVPVWVEEHVIIENLTEDCEVGLVNLNENGNVEAAADVNLSKNAVMEEAVPIRVEENVIIENLTGDTEGKHNVLPPCEDSCFLRCRQNISDDQRYRINQAFWDKSLADRRAAHAPKTLYLPSDVTIILMHKDFLEKYPNSKGSYEVYKVQVKKMKISFTKLGHKECETCEQYKLHGHNENNLNDDCEDCIKWRNHIDAATKSRKLYK
ncbi:uncharacterized protein LOC128984342 [Macrosteles quadrilineatus]|uniref:uncharacterized protein LOC128984342 n=1 Tax=Macrosteles quadrilineatus TaxID=74068 RepID=UPI0023E18BB8|nr:uncharacterized protein LOC128984342 [Macrosteles quadrilineatus]